MSTPDYAPPRVVRIWALSEIISWAFVALAIVTVLVATFILHRQAPAPVDERPSVQLLISSRYIVGANRLTPLKTTGQAARLVKSLEEQAKTPADKFRVAIVHGELEGKEAEAADFARLRGQHPPLAPDIDLVESLGVESQPSETSPEWTAFRKRHGWFADLALSQDRPPGDPLRTATMNAAFRTLGALAGFVMLVGFMGLLGVVLLILGIVLYTRGRLKFSFQPPMSVPPDRRACVQGFAMYLCVMIFAGVLLRMLVAFVHVPVGLQANWILPMAFVAGITWPLIRRRSWGDFKDSVGLHRGRGVMREIVAGLAGYLAGLPIIAVGIFVTYVLSRFGGTETSHPIVQEVTSGRSRLLLFLALASLYAPITEELMFRGLLFAHLRERFGFWFSALAVALVFAIIHPQGWAGVPALASIALVLAGIREWRGSIIGCMTAHALNNTVVMLMLIAAVS